MFEFIIPGKPQAKARPRFTRRGGVYTTSQTIEYEKHVRACFHLARMEQAYLIPRDCAILVSIEAVFPIPASWSKAKRQEALEGKLAHMGKPDWDNVGKIITDALNQVAWNDDSQIISASVIKTYGAEPRVIVRIYGGEK